MLTLGRRAGFAGRGMETDQRGAWGRMGESRGGWGRTWDDAPRRRDAVLASPGTALPGRLHRLVRMTRAQVQARRDMVFVYADDMSGAGVGPLAATIRGEVNAIGIPVMWRGAGGPGATFSNADWRDPRVRAAIEDPERRVRAALLEGRDVAIPADGLGGLPADLVNRAPAIAEQIDRWLRDLAAAARY
jgi:hypothetical protein